MLVPNKTPTISNPIRISLRSFMYDIGPRANLILGIWHDGHGGRWFRRNTKSSQALNDFLKPKTMKIWDLHFKFHILWCRSGCFRSSDFNVNWGLHFSRTAPGKSGVRMETNIRANHLKVPPINPMAHNIPLDLLDSIRLDSIPLHYTISLCLSWNLREKKHHCLTLWAPKRQVQQHRWSRVARVQCHRLWSIKSWLQFMAIWCNFAMIVWNCLWQHLDTYKLLWISIFFWTILFCFFCLLAVPDRG